MERLEWAATSSTGCYEDGPAAKVYFNGSGWRPLDALISVSLIEPRAGSRRVTRSHRPLRRTPNMLATLLLTAALAAPPAAADTTSAAESPDIAAVRKQDDALQAAHGRGDMATYRAGLSAHYVYIDIAGKRVTADLLNQRREADQRRVVSSESVEEEAVQLSDTAVLLRGHERSLSVYYGGLPRVGETRWTALWVKEADGIWRLTAETATPVRKHAGLPFVAQPQPRAVLDALAGDWVLDTTPALSLNLRAVDDGLVARLHGQSLDWTFQPASARHFFALERPFELRISADGQHLEMITWGTATQATRAAPIQNGGADQAHSNGRQGQGKLHSNPSANTRS